MFLSLCFCSLSLWGQAEKYSRARVLLEDQSLSDLSMLGIAVDHGEYRKGYAFTSDFSEKEILIIKQAGFKVETLIHDVKAHYKEQNFLASEAVVNSTANLSCQRPSRYFNTPNGFSLGSMGGFFTYQEALAHLDSMVSRYPNLITQKDTLNYRTREGRHVYWLKISDNPNQDENEPEILYDAVHHAREPNSLSQLIFYMYYLLENYGVNDEVTYLVNETEMYFVPCINPDGYIYNQINDPNGGGMWRKNRRDLGNGEFGVDLNRNYGHTWGYDNVGSSGNFSSQTYRGDAPFSEPETQNMRDFCEAHSFEIALNYHTYGDMLIYPWGYDYSIFTPDSAEFVEFAMLLTEDNRYIYGTGDQTVGYIVNGDSDDWMYGEQSTKQKIYSMTPEAGPYNYGFWPPAVAIDDVCRENIWQNLSAAHLLHNYGEVSEEDLPFLVNMNGHIHFDLKRLGLKSDSLWVTVASLNNITFIDSVKAFNSLNHLEIIQDSFQYMINNGVISGDTLSYVLGLSNGYVSIYDTIYKVFGDGQLIFEEQGDSIHQWSVSGWWNTTNQIAYSGNSSITDSPNGPYNKHLDDDIMTADFIDLENATGAYLEFYARWQIEQNYDYVQLQAKDTLGNDYALCTEYSKTGTPYQDEDEPIFDGMNMEWKRHFVDLSDFIGQKIKLGFRIYSDSYTQFDGFYFDDFRVYALGIGVHNALNEVNSKGIRLFPNPTSGNLQIWFEDVNIEKLQVFNPLGVLVYEAELNRIKKHVLIDVKEWSKGMYNVQLWSQEGNKLHKSIIVL